MIPPTPSHLTAEERALWEKATAAREWFDGTRADAAAREALLQISMTVPETILSLTILSLLTALSSEREAGERDRRLLDGMELHGLTVEPRGGDRTEWIAYQFPNATADDIEDSLALTPRLALGLALAARALTPTEPTDAR